MKAYTSEWHEAMTIGRTFFERLRDDANKAREGLGFTPAQKMRVGQQKQKKTKGGKK